MAGGLPGSNTHRWGSRAFELRTTPAGTVEVRIHDTISFQGVGMRPEDMAPDSHQCTPWEALPPAIAMPTATTCADDRATCDAIRAFYTSTAKPPVLQGPTMIVQHDSTYGRGIVECS